MSSEIYFFSEDIEFQLASDKVYKKWLDHVADTHHVEIGFLNYIFCSDDYLHKLNVEYLSHDTLTDIITFPAGEEDGVSGDIFISIERIKENAATYRVEFEQELHRVIAHGLLHLIGFADKTQSEKEEMKKEEDKAISLFF